MPALAVNWLLDAPASRHQSAAGPLVQNRHDESQMRNVRWILLEACGAVLLLGVLMWLRRRN